MPGIQNIFLSVLLCCVLSSCATQEQAAKPLDSQAITAKILEKDPNGEAFQEYLIQRGYAKERLPLKEWGLDELTLCALYYHTALFVAKEQQALAELAVKSAGLKSKPSINAEIAHSNLKNDDLKPWAFGLSVDIPVATNNKRVISVEKAEQQLAAAQLDVAEVAWQLRQQLATELLNYHQNQLERSLLEEALATQTMITAMLEKRVNAGIASKTELSNVNLMTLKTEHALRENHAQEALIKARLAADTGLTLEQFSAIKIKPISIDSTIAKQTNILSANNVAKTLQQDALLNRIDIRRAIAEYAAAEAEIRLEVAKLTPDITLSPGIFFDFGDTIWSLGFSSLFNSLNKNTIFLEQATQLREIEGKQFEHLQAQTIAAISQAQVRYQTATQTREQAEQQLSKQLTQMQKVQKQFDAGLIGKVELKRFALNSIVAKEQLLASKLNLIRSAIAIEDVMQKPLYTSFSMPQPHNE